MQIDYGSVSFILWVIVAVLVGGVHLVLKQVERCRVVLEEIRDMIPDERMQRILSDFEGQVLGLGIAPDKD